VCVFPQAELEKLRGLLQKELDWSEASQKTLLSLDTSVSVDLNNIRCVQCGAQWQRLLVAEHQPGG